VAARTDHQELIIKAKVLNANLVAMRMLYGDANNMTPATRKAAAPAQVLGGAAVADRNAPAIRSSERTGGDSHFVTTGIPSSPGTCERGLVESYED
jgi:hypothetical protein